MINYPTLADTGSDSSVLNRNNVARLLNEVVVCGRLLRVLKLEWRRGKRGGVCR
jgi:hypothetical protein